MTEPTPTPDFTRPREPHRFRLGGKDYAAPAIISAPTIRRAVEVGGALRSSDSTDTMAVAAAIGQTFEVLIPGPQGQEIAERLTSEDDPIDFKGEAMPCLEWLMGVYGLRPTKPSSDSSNGSHTPTDDTPSTDGASAEASTSTS